MIYLVLFFSQGFEVDFQIYTVPSGNLKILQGRERFLLIELL